MNKDMDPTLNGHSNGFRTDASANGNTYSFTNPRPEFKPTNKALGLTGTSVDQLYQIIRSSSPMNIQGLKMRNRAWRANRK